jgi:hypothetical protein
VRTRVSAPADIPTTVRYVPKLPVKSYSRKTRRISWTAAADAASEPRVFIGFANGNVNRQAKKFLEHFPARPELGCLTLTLVSGCSVDIAIDQYRRLRRARPRVGAHAAPLRHGRTGQRPRRSPARSSAPGRRPRCPPVMRHLTAAGVTSTGIPSPSASPAPLTSRLSVRARRKQHRCSIVAAPATSMSHRCRFRSRYRGL